MRPQVPLLPVLAAALALTLPGFASAQDAPAQQIQQFATGDFEQEAKTWTMMKDHMYVIADALAGGLAKQFPDKFH